LDCFFCEGVSVLFQVGLALFNIAEEKIMSLPIDDNASEIILEYMQDAVSTKVSFHFISSFRLLLSFINTRV